MPQDPSFRTIELSSRPPRVAVLLDCTDEAWMDTCLRVIEWSTSVWGGWHSCLIPTDGVTIDERFWGLLERFDPDEILVYERTGQDTEIANPAAFQARVEEEVERHEAQRGFTANGSVTTRITTALRTSRDRPLTLSPTLLEQLGRRINPFRYGTQHDPRPITARPMESNFPLTNVGAVTRNLPATLHVASLDVEASLPVQLMVHSSAGKTWPGLVRRLQRENADVQTQTLRPQEGLSTVLSQLMRGERYAAALPLAACAEYSLIGEEPDRDAVLVVIGDRLEDFCLSYNLDRLRGRVCWLPHGLIDPVTLQEQPDVFRGDDLGESNMGWQLTIAVAATARGAAVQTTSFSLDEEALAAATGTLVNFGQFNCQTLPGGIVPLPYIRQLYCRDTVGLRYRDMFPDRESVNWVNAPLPKNLTDVPPTGLYWITEVGIEGYRLPARPEFGPSTLVCPPYNSGEIRVTRRGFAYLCPHIAYFGGDVENVLIRPQIRLMEPMDIFQRLFAASDRHLSLSDKGDYHTECVKKFGSLASFADFFRNETHRRLLTRYADRGRSEDGKGDRIRERRYLDLAAFERVIEEGEDVIRAVAEAEEGISTELRDAAPAARMREIRRSHVEEPAAVLIARLAGQAVLRRGFIFKCGACRQMDWYAVEDVTDRFRCLRCRTSQVYTRQHWGKPREPSWFYQLDEIVYQAFDHDEYIPTLTLDALRRSAGDAFLYLPACELRRNAGERNALMELDFVCCLDGDVFIGEAKKADKLEAGNDQERTALRKYKDLAERVGAKAVVMSTFSPSWNARTLASAEEIIGADRLRLYNGSELVAPVRE